MSAVREGGALVLNGDDADVRAYRTLAPRGTRIISYGFGEAVDVRASTHASALSLFPFRTQKYAALAGLAVVAACGFDMARAGVHLARALPAPGRMRMLEGIRGARIIDDSYNSSPVAVEEALHAFAEMPVKGRRIAVLGDMLELGNLSPVEHRKMVEHAVRSADLVFLVGERACATGIMSGKIRIFRDARAAGEALAQDIRTGDLVLIKGSQGMRLERAVERIMREPARASSLLVRQEPEWKKRS